MTPRTARLGVFGVVLMVGGFAVGAEAPDAAATRALRQAGWRLRERTPHEELWESPRANGKPPESTPRGRLSILGAGLNRWDAAIGAWVPAEARFEPDAGGGFAAPRAAHQVRLARNLNRPAAVEVLTADGQRLRSTPVGLAYRESDTGRTVRLAEVQDCRATRVSATEVIYRDAFDGLAADVRYTIGLDRFEQDVILRAAPPSPGQHGLEATRTELIVLTEFVEAPAGADADGEAEGWLRFGGAALAPGTAFSVGSPGTRPEATSRPAGAPIRKSWQVLGGRTFLLESVGCRAVEALLAELPPAPAAASRLASVGWELPAPRRSPVAVTGAQAGVPDRVLARRDDRAELRVGDVGREPGLVLDYMLITTPSITLAGDMTYFVAGPLIVQNLTIEGGAVVKYDTNETAHLTVTGSIECRTGPYRPAIFTHKFDATVGEPVATGDPGTVWVGYPMLEVARCPMTLQFLRFRHAKTAIQFSGQGACAQSLRDVQLAHCETGLAVTGESATHPVALDLGNVLAAEVGTLLGGEFFRATAAHLTADRVKVLVRAGATSNGNSLAATNSVLANVTAISQGPARVGGAYNGFWNSPAFGNLPRLLAGSNPFQTVGAGVRYLVADSSFRGAGTAKMDSELLSHLRSWGTTQPPVVWTNTINDERVWAPIVPRSFGPPDLGYHYAALDYAVSDLTITRAGLTLTNGVAVAAFGPRGFKPEAGGQLVSIGTPASLNVLTRYNLVQEETGSAWDQPGEATILYPPRGPTVPPPQVECRFTRLTAPAFARLLTGPGVGIYRFADCQLAGGELAMDTLSAGSSGMAVTLENCLLEGVASSFTDHNDPASLLVRQCTFWHGQAWFRPGAAHPFQVRDTFFDTTLVSASTGVDHDYNGYVSGSSRLLPPALHDAPVAAESPAYAKGPLGDRYLPAASVLRDAGSRADAADAGLYHHTTSATDQSREEHTRVDVGFHYVGCTGGLPTDTDTDALPDRFEDSNGNGALDPGETSFTSADTDPTDGLDDRQTHALRFNMLVNDPQQDFANEQNSQWQPKVVANGDQVVVAFWDSNQGRYGLASGTDRGTNRMVGWAVSADGGVSFADHGQPPLATAASADRSPLPPNRELPWGDAGDPVLAIDRQSNVIYLAGTSERRPEAFRGVPLWKSTDGGQTFTRAETVAADLQQTDYPWIAVDDWPSAEGGTAHDVYLAIRTLGPGIENQKLYLLVAPDGNLAAGNWTQRELAGFGATMHAVAVGPDRVAYVAWLQQSGQYPALEWSLELRAVGNRGTSPNLLGETAKTVCKLSPGPDATLALLRTGTGNADDFFKAFRHPALAVNPTQPGHVFVVFADRGPASDRAEVFFTCSRDGGRTWLDAPQRLGSLDGSPTGFDQWAPVLAVRPDGRQMIAAWLDRRNDPANALIDVYGRWGTVADDGSVTWGRAVFRITTESFPPAYAGTFEANRSPGHYDPVWPPSGVTLEWWYPWWPLDFPPDDYVLTAPTYRHETGEHNGAFGTASDVFIVWADNRRESVGSRHFPERRQSDVRLARIPWPGL